MDIPIFSVCLPGFNPLPSQKQGETSEGVPLVQTNTEFQSAPLTKARGDLRGKFASVSLHGFNPLPSQKQGETLHMGFDVPQLKVSIRSPHKSKGRHRRDGALSSQIFVSIRSPHKSKGRRTSAAGRKEDSSVSIRSPHKSKGRLTVFRTDIR